MYVQRFYTRRSRAQLSPISVNTFLIKKVWTRRKAKWKHCWAAATEVVLFLLKQSQHAPMQVYAPWSLLISRWTAAFYVEVIDTANYGFAASSGPHSSINVPCYLFLHTLAQDHLLYRNVFLNGAVTHWISRKKPVNKYNGAPANNLNCIRNRIEMLLFIDTE